jgi:hypothetical protein
VFFVILELTVVHVMVFATVGAGPGLPAILNNMFIILTAEVLQDLLLLVIPGRRVNFPIQDHSLADYYINSIVTV